MTFVNGYTPPTPTFDPTAYTTTAPVSSATAPSNPASFYSSPTAPTSTATAPGAPGAPNLGSSTAGIYVAIATIGGILVSGTQVAPIAFGLLGVALIFQIQGILTGG